MANALVQAVLAGASAPGTTRAQRRRLRRAHRGRVAPEAKRWFTPVYHRHSPPGEYSNYPGFVVHLDDGRVLRLTSASQSAYSVMESVLPAPDALVYVGPPVEQFGPLEFWCAVDSRQLREGLSSIPCRQIPKHGWIGTD